MANCGTRTALHGSFHWTLRSRCSGDLISSVAEGLPLVQRQEDALLACILEIVFPHFTYLAEGPSSSGYTLGCGHQGRVLTSHCRRQSGLPGAKFPSFS